MFKSAFARWNFINVSGNAFGNSISSGEKIRNSLDRLTKNFAFLSSRKFNRAARTPSHTIGVMVPNLSNVFYADVIRGIENTASAHGFSIYLSITAQTPEKENYHINEMVKRHVAGLIVLSTNLMHSKVIKKIAAEMPIVSIQTDVDGVDTISVTDEQGMFEVTEHLANLGHKKIAFIGYDNNVSAVANRLIGYIKASRKHDIPINESYIRKEAFTSSGYVCVKQLLQTKDRPTAIQCTNDKLAIGAYMAAAELGLKIPDDISISGFDDTIIARLMSPQLTTVSQPALTMGETSVALLIRRINEGNNFAKQSIVLPTVLILRGSTAPPAI